MPLHRTYLNIFLNISLWVFFYMFIYVFYYGYLYILTLFFYKRLVMSPHYKGPDEKPSFKSSIRRFIRGFRKGPFNTMIMGMVEV